MKKITFIVSGLLTIGTLSAQKLKNDGTDPALVDICTNVRETKPLTELFADQTIDFSKLKKGKEESRDKDFRKPQTFKKTVKDGPQYGNDSAIMQNFMGNIPWPKAPIKSFGGLSNQNFDPLDPTGAAGPSHYVQMINSTVFKVFNKSTGANMLTGTLGTLWTPDLTYNDGDPVVLYDKPADRWFLAQFGDNYGSAGNKIHIAISKTNDPTGAYYTFDFTMPAFTDYPKFSVWQNGYYMTTNYGSPTRIFCFERDSMLLGKTSRMVSQSYSIPSNGFFCPLTGDASDGVLPPAGTPCPIFSYSDNGWGGTNTDAVHIYKMTVNWGASPSATIASAATLATNTFDASYNSSLNDVSQPGTTSKLDGIGGVPLFRSQWKSWTSSGYNSVCLTWAVKISSTQRGLMWCELRQNQSTSAWSIFQQGIYNPDTDNRWMGSIAMDNNGSIALCYLKSNSTTTYPGLYYTGRRSCDPVGTLPLTEAVAKAGTGSHTSSNRNGDYAQTTLDPDGITFWHTGMYFGSSGSNQTQVYSFQIAACSAVVPTAAFTTPSSICAGTAAQFTDASTGSPTSWAWSVTPSTGVTINTASSQNPMITFTTAQTYTVSLTATNAAGSSTPVTHTVTVTTCSVTPPTAAFTAPTGICTATPKQFTDASTGSPTGWAWSVSPNTGVTVTTASSQNPMITFTTAGTYSVTLTASNSGGSSSPVTHTVSVTTCTTSATCDTLTNFTAVDTLFNGDMGGGYVAGNNTYADKAKGEWYSSASLAGYKLTGGIVLFYRNNSANQGTKGTANININTYNGTNATSGGGPTGTAIATHTVAISTITAVTPVTGVTYCGNPNLAYSTPIIYPYSFTYTTQPTITQDFVMTVTLPANGTDTVAIFMSGGSQLAASTAWEKQSDNVWYPFNNGGAPTWQINSSLAILPKVCPSTLTITENSLYNYMALYPNPNNGMFSCVFAMPESADLNFSVTNMLGQEVMTKKVNNVTSQVIQFDLSQYGKGVYFVNVVSSDGKNAVMKVTVE